MISASARAKFDASIRAAESAGARLLAGGRPLDGPGWFYAPVVLQAHDAEPEGRLAGCFGPVVLVRGVASADEAVAAANSLPFGLAGSVWGSDRREARRLAGRLEVGMVSINDAVAPSAHASAPFGGFKASGFGRTRGELGLREFARPQTLTVRRRRPPAAAFPLFRPARAAARRVYPHPASAVVGLDRGVGVLPRRRPTCIRACGGRCLYRKGPPTGHLLPVRRGCTIPIEGPLESAEPSARPLDFSLPGKGYSHGPVRGGNHVPYHDRGRG